MSARLKELYKREIVARLMKDFNYKSVMQVPKIHKIVVNMGLGEAIQNPKVIDVASLELAAITGQKPSVRKSKKAIANFKLKAGVPIGLTVTLRNDRMYEFYDRLVNVALPRVRDFKGIPSRSFDGKGNFSMGLKEQVIFPEINYDKVEKIKGMNITIVTTAKSDDEARALLKYLGMPLRN